MRKILLLLLLFIGGMTAHAQDTSSSITLKTSLSEGEEINLWITTLSKETPVKIDWGDGVVQSYHIAPAAYDYEKKVSGHAKGTVRILTKIAGLDATRQHVTAIEITHQDSLRELILAQNELTDLNLSAGAPKLKRLDLHGNRLTYDHLDLTGCANTLEQLNLDDNQLNLFLASDFNQLKEFSANNNSSLSTVIFPDDSENLTAISMNNCDISHFYPIDLPRLSSLSLENGSLLDLETGRHYPALKSLDIMGNQIQTLDLTNCPLLEQLNCAHNSFSTLNLTKNTKLSQLSCGENQLKELNTLNNLMLTRLDCHDNELSRLPLNHLKDLTYLNCSKNKIDYLDLTENAFLSRLEMADNLIDFLNFDQNTQLKYIDIRNNPRLTPYALNFGFSTLPALRRVPYSNNLLIAGTQAEHCDTSYPTSYDMHWKVDVKGDGTAKADSVALEITPANDGTAIFMASTNEYGQAYKPIGKKVKMGVPIHVIHTPSAGAEYQGVLVNGILRAGVDWFVINAPSTAKALFEKPGYAKLGVTKGTEMKLRLAATAKNGALSIDWGNGEWVKQNVGNTPQYITGEALGDTMRIKGELTVLDVSSYPGIGWDNQITSVDVSACPNLKELNTYMNEIESIDVSNCPDLMVLDCSYGDIENLDISKNTKLTQLYCFGNSLDTLDVSHAPNLRVLEAKNNYLRNIDLSENPAIRKLKVQNNKLKTLNVSNLSSLSTLEANDNALTDIDLSNNASLDTLNLANNQLTLLNLEKNPSLKVLQTQGNHLHRIQGLENMTRLVYFDISDNHMTACELNDIYFDLPNYQTAIKPQQIYTFLVKGTHEETANDAEHATSSMAKMKGWKINYDGDGSGCADSYVKILPAEHGSLSLKTENGKTIISGTKVTKGTALQIVATPEKGYETESLTANNQKLASPLFTVKSYTEFAAIFSLTTGINKVEKDNVTMSYSDGMLHIALPERASLEIFNIKGYSVYVKNAKEHRVRLSKGTYIVLVNGRNYKVLL